MIKKFNEFIAQENLFKHDDKILIAVSGGIDSMTLLHLFNQCNFNFSVAHCNFKLREQESDGDQEFLERFCIDNKIELFVKSFDTKETATMNKVSIQMAARELRYNWFEKTIKENGFSKYATAHNLNDIAETFIINLTRGTGIKGLSGIKAKNGNLVRPLLFAKRTEIESYAKENNINFRHDSSNNETKYLRNAIRHKIIPVLESLNPSVLDSIKHTTSLLKGAENSYLKEVNHLKKKILKPNGQAIQLDFAEITSHKLNAELMYEIIADHGFSYDIAKKLTGFKSLQAGKTFYSKTHKIVCNRDAFLLIELVDSDCEEYELEMDNEQHELPVKLNFKKLEANNNLEISRNTATATLDFDLLTFPLKIRRWRHGDVFHPFGMKGKKKLSDYFTDQKFSLIDKDNVWLLTSGDEIVWIINHRTDNRFRITQSTKKILEITYKELSE